jgi:hypothetical protein
VVILWAEKPQDNLDLFIEPYAMNPWAVFSGPYRKSIPMDDCENILMLVTLGQYTAVTSGKLMCGRDQSNSNRQAIADYRLSCLIPLAGYSLYAQTGFLLCVLLFVIAAL